MMYRDAFFDAIAEIEMIRYDQLLQHEWTDFFFFFDFPLPRCVFYTTAHEQFIINVRSKGTFFFFLTP